MNPRIKQLAEQAGITTNLDTDFFSKGDVNGWVDYFAEKFGELIVEECILKAHGARIRGESINDLIERIGEDFGVSESEWFDEDPPC